MSIQIILFDQASWRDNLLPIVATRPVGNIRIGILTLDEKWGLIFKSPVAFYTATYLQQAFPSIDKSEQEFLVIRADFIPNKQFIEALVNLNIGERLMYNGDWIAFKTVDIGSLDDNDKISVFTNVVYENKIDQIIHLEHIYLHNAAQIQFDYDLLTQGRESSKISNCNFQIGNQLFVEEGVSIQNCSLNTLDGPIYIGKNAKIEEGALLKGPIAICEGARVKMGAKIYSNVTVGNRSTVAGEINNTVIWGDSAKGHDGYLGCAVIGQYCNLGAGTSNSNLRNDWKHVSLYNYKTESFRDTNLLKCGLIMGDLSLCAIQSAFTTGTVIGVGVQIALNGFISTYVSDFTWLTPDKNELYEWAKFKNMLQCRGNVLGSFLSKEKILILEAVYQQSKHKKEIKSTQK